eukprot:6425108-Amphidinium_carterae.1
MCDHTTVLGGVLVEEESAHNCLIGAQILVSTLYPVLLRTATTNRTGNSSHVGKGSENQQTLHATQASKAISM